jgi:uncharacterized protein (DUF362 family)
MSSSWGEPVSNASSLSRRHLLELSGIGVAGAGAGIAASHLYHRIRQPQASVTIVRAGSYRQPLRQLMVEALRNYPEVVRRARTGTVVLKPNLVEYKQARRINTHPAVVAAAIGAFRSLGAKDVVVAEGPGHCRDTELLLEESGLASAVADERATFLDLNLDSVRPVPLAANRTRLGHIFFSETLLGASLVVSMPKLKTHHWAGVTLSLKNMFGTVPGAVYGWPKNILHWRGIDNSITDINVALRPSFAIIDGIEGMEGDGPLLGDTVAAGVLIMGDNLTAVDATAARVMGLYPERVAHLRQMLPHGGTLHEARIEQRGEPLAAVRREFQVLSRWAELKRPAPPAAFLRGL